MKFCCLFHSKKRYAYQVGTYAGSYVVQRVLVRECDIFHSLKIMATCDHTDILIPPNYP